MENRIGRWRMMTGHAEEVARSKKQPDKELLLLGSAPLVSTFMLLGLIDEYQIVVIPVVLGGGRTMFEGLKEQLSLALTNTRAFGNGNVLLCYEPVA